MAKVERRSLKFRTTQRKERIVLWVDYGYGWQSIWDVKESSIKDPCVLDAVVSAFILGWKGSMVDAHNYFLQNQNILPGLVKDVIWEIKKGEG